VTEPVVFEGFPLEPDRGELKKLLGRLRGEAALEGAEPGTREERIDAALDSALEEAAGLIEAKGIYRIVSGAELEGPGLPRELERVAVCVCTIGPALERRAREMMGSGRLFYGFMLDTVGSAAAEAAAGYMDERISEAAAAEGLRTSCRASPGYGDWDVGGQRGIFDLLPAGRIGVTLTEGLMMRPLKSVSFAVHVGEEPVRLRSESSCENCGMEDCPYDTGD